MQVSLHVDVASGAVCAGSNPAGAPLLTSPKPADQRFYAGLKLIRVRTAWVDGPDQPGDEPRRGGSFKL